MPLNTIKQEGSEDENKSYRADKTEKTFNPVQFKNEYFENLNNRASDEDSLEDKTEDIQSMMTDTEHLRESLGMKLPRKFQVKSKLKDYQTDSINLKSVREDLKKFQFIKKYKAKYNITNDKP